MSEPNTTETKIDDIKERADLLRDPTEEPGESPPSTAANSRPQIDPQDLFDSSPLLEQLEMQVGLLTSAMSKNMILSLIHI